MLHKIHATDLDSKGKIAFETLRTGQSLFILFMIKHDYKDRRENKRRFSFVNCSSQCSSRCNLMHGNAPGRMPELIKKIKKN